MKKLYQKALMGIVLGVATLPAFSQDNLRYGAAPLPEVVAAPHFYRDILRLSSPGWVQQTYNTGTGDWFDFEKTVNLKNADGRFTELSTYMWNMGVQNWDEEYKSLCTFTKNGANEVVEITSEVVSPFNNFANRYMLTYNQGRLTESELSYRNGGVYVPSANTIFSYDIAGKRIKDSTRSVQGGAQYTRSYEYDNNSRCFSITTMGVSSNNTWDTLAKSMFEYYTDGRVKRNVFYYRFNGGPLSDDYHVEFSYTQNGQVDEVLVSLRDMVSGILEPNSHYKHYYNAQNKPTAMVTQTYTASSWANSDSLALNYLPNGQYDTGYVYLSSGANAWRAQPTHRLVFEKVNTGIRTPISGFGLRAYPNPATENLTVEFTPAISGKTQLVLTDITGKTIKTLDAGFIAGQLFTQTLAVNDIAPGIYMLRAGGQTLKVLVE